MHKNKIIFALTTKGNDIYTQLTRAAIASIRLTNYDYVIHVFCDKDSLNKLQEQNSLLLQEVDEIKAVETPFNDPVSVNRYIKINLCQWVKGPFVFMDSDVLVREKLDWLFEITEDVGLAMNHSLENKEHQIWREDAKELKEMGWETNYPYFNGGVIYYSGNEVSKKFSETWYENWIENTQKTGRLRDQPSLNYSLYMMGDSLTIKTIPKQFNHQFVRNEENLKESSVWHYYAAIELSNKTELEKYLKKQLSKNEAINYQAMADLIKSKTPYTKAYFLERQIRIVFGLLRKIVHR